MKLLYDAYQLRKAAEFMTERYPTLYHNIHVAIKHIKGLMEEYGDDEGFGAALNGVYIYLGPINKDRIRLVDIWVNPSIGKETIYDGEIRL